MGVRGIRPKWDPYFLAIAETVALRADCSRRQVGCVIVDANRRVVSTGYNGSPRGGPSCLLGACPRATSGVSPGSSYDTGVGVCIALHAEQNALLYSDYSRITGGTAYITDKPCDGCTRLLRGTTLATVIWPEGRFQL